MTRYGTVFRAIAMGGALAVTGVSSAVAEEVRLRLKGGGFEITGDLVSYDGNKYVVSSPVFGTMSIDGTRFECVDNCPSGPVAAKQRPGTGAAPLSGDIVVAGSNTVGNALMPALIESFAESQGYETTRVVGADPLDLTFKVLNSRGDQAASIQLLRYGSSTSFRELAAGKTEIGMSSRPIKDEEVAALATAGLGNMRAPTNEHVLGLDGLMIIVSPDNPAVSISIDNVSRIFAGEITNWSQIGLPPGPINIYAPAADSGTFETFKNLVLKPAGVKLSPATKRTENHAQQSDWVAGDPNGIGFVGIAYQRNAKALNIQSSCGLISRPTRFDMKTEEYPLTRRLYLYSPGTPKQTLARDLLSFAISDAAQDVVSATDFIDQRPETLPFKNQGARIAYALNAEDEDFDLAAMRNLISDVSKGERLTTTLRFETASFALDSKAAADVERLARLLQTDEYKGRQIMLIGFADSIGNYAANLALSERRAIAVQEALGKSGFKGNLEIKGYSELAPVACNDTPEKRRFNRRVEVWVK